MTDRDEAARKVLILGVSGGLPHQHVEQMRGDEIHRLRREVAALRAQIADLAAKLVTEGERRAAVQAERDAARQVAEWNAQAGGFSARQMQTLQARSERLEALLSDLADAVFSAGLTADNTSVWRRARAALQAAPAAGQDGGAG